MGTALLHNACSSASTQLYASAHRRACHGSRRGAFAMSARAWGSTPPRSRNAPASAMRWSPRGAWKLRATSELDVAADVVGNPTFEAQGDPAAAGAVVVVIALVILLQVRAAASERARDGRNAAILKLQVLQARRVSEEITPQALREVELQVRHSLGPGWGPARTQRTPTVCGPGGVVPCSGVGGSGSWAGAWWPSWSPLNAWCCLVSSVRRRRPLQPKPC
jgi:hypothetical protein